MLIALFYVFKPYVVGFDTIWEYYNNALIFMGLGIGFSTLQDTTKTQNKMSRKIWECPKKGKRMLIIMASMTLIIILVGLFGSYFSTLKPLKELSFGIIILGLGFLGLLKAAIEIYENHRLDKNIK